MAENDGIFLQLEQPSKTAQVSAAKANLADFQQDLAIPGSRAVNFTNFGFAGFG